MKRLTSLLLIATLLSGTASASGGFWGDLRWGESAEAIWARHPWWSISSLGGYRGDIEVLWFRGIPEDLSVPDFLQGLVYSDEVQYWFFRGGLVGISVKTNIVYSPTLEELQARSVGIHRALREYYGEPDLSLILKKDPATGEYTERVDHLYENPRDIPPPWMLQLIWHRDDIDTTIAFSFIAQTNYVMVDMVQASVASELDSYISDLTEADYIGPRW